MMIAKCSEVRKYFPIRRGWLKEKMGLIKAVDGVSFEIRQKETFGLVGESGCGKTTLGKMLLGIMKPDAGKIELNAERPQVIFQDPHNSLDPKMRVRDIIAEGLILRPDISGFRAHAALGRAGKIQDKAEEVLDMVRLPKSALKKYPHQFSGGERQRIAIARAIATDPEFIVCDEPVSSLDVTIQLEILRLLKDIQKRLSITYLFISHDLRVIRFMSDRIAVMKDGKIVEEGLSQDVYSRPGHPYTKLLLSSILTIYETDR